MTLRTYCWPSLGQLALFLLIRISVDAQPVKVEGYAISSGSYITEFNGSYFTVQKNDGEAVVDLNGKILASGIKAPSSIGFRNYKLSMYRSVYFADIGNGIVLKNASGQSLGAGKYSDIQPFVTGNTAVRVPSAPGTWIAAYLDTAGKEIVRFDVKKYLAIADPLSKIGGSTFVTLSEFLPFSEGLTPIKSKVSGKCGFINKSLQLVIPVSFREACPFSEGLAAVQNADGNWGFINTAGKLVIPYDYSQRPGRFTSGLARVQDKQGKMGYINKENKVVIAPRYEFATWFYKGYALARAGYNQPVYLIDTTGATVATFPKDVLYIDDSKPPMGISGTEQAYFPFYISETLRQLVEEGEGIFMKGTSYGLIDKKGNIVLDFKYQHLSDLHSGKMFAHNSAYFNGASHNDLGIINDKGDWLVQIVASGF